MDLGFIMQPLPPDVDEQTRLIVEAGIPQQVMSDIGFRADARYWVAVRADGGRSELYLFSDSPTAKLVRAATPIAVDTIEAHNSAFGLSLTQLTLLEQLALGDEEFVLRLGMRLVWVGPTEGAPVPTGTALQVSALTFGYVQFHGLPGIAFDRSGVTRALFIDLPE